MTENSPLTLSQLARRHPAFSVSSLRWIRFRSQDPADNIYSPFADAFLKVGGRVLVDEQKFFAIVRNRGDQ